jgi:4-amino-4-deoxy-L-arabinose transferase-like glycosyltransferase
MDAPVSTAPGTLACPRAGRRLAVYALLLTALASAACFYRLGEGTLDGDEAAFAFTTDRMRATGDWVVPYLGDEPHLNATPLYNWLTLAVAPWFDEAPVWYRFWSAVCGVACVLLTFLLGATLFRAEVGFLAALFLALNRDFLCSHGVRFGGMDALTAACVTAAVAAYARLHANPGRARLAWAVVGLAVGLAWLSKPPVFGGFFLAALGLHHLVAHRGVPPAARARGPALALVVGLAVAGGWYALLWLRLGNEAIHQLFVFNSVGRALGTEGRDLACCHRSFWHASIGFKLMWPALAAAGACWVVRERRARWGLVLFVAGGFLAALTAAGTSRNYIYYAFPLLCVPLAGLFLECGPRLAARCWPGPTGRARARAVGACLAVLVVGADAVNLGVNLSGPAWVHPPLRFYTRLAQDVDQGRCRLILVGFPGSHPGAPATLAGANFEDLYYGPRMTRADRAASLAELKRLLEDPRPAVVVMPPLDRSSPDLAGVGGLGPDARADVGVWARCTYPVLTFHGAAAQLRLGDLMTTARRADR